MRHLRIPAVLTLVAVMAFGQLACDKNKMVSYAGDVVSALTDASPLLVQAGVDTIKLDKAVGIANQLVQAFKNNDTSGAVNLTSVLITQFQIIAGDASNVSNPATRTRILVALALGNVALHYISNHIVTEAASVPAGRRGAPALSVIRQEAERPIWRCRSSKTGRFEKMAECRAHPDTTQVERF